MASCTFCNKEDLEEGLLDETPSFYHRANVLGAIAPGHSMIISKKHYSCFGEMPPNSDEDFNSYLASVKTRFSKVFGDPILVEQGIHGQSINHAHLHFFPRVSEWYDFSESERFIDFIPPGISVSEVGGIQDIRKIFDDDGQYVLIGENSSLYVCHTKEFDGNLRPVREFPSKLTGLTNLLNWQTVSQEEKLKNTRWVEETIEKLKTK